MRPMPREPPVTRAVRPASEKRSFMRAPAEVSRRPRRRAAGARATATPRPTGHGRCCGDAIRLIAARALHDARIVLEQKWPQTLWIVRHGQSAGNVARDAAELGGLAHRSTSPTRDVDVPLSPLGEQQADALGRLVRRAAARRAARGRAELALRARAPDRDARRCAAPLRRRRRRRDRLRARRAPAREGVRHPRPPDAARHPRQVSRAGRAARGTSASSTSGRPAARAGAT